MVKRIYTTILKWFCKHKEVEFIRMLRNDEIRSGSTERSIWRCVFCNKVHKRGVLFLKSDCLSSSAITIVPHHIRSSSVAELNDSKEMAKTKGVRKTVDDDFSSSLAAGMLTNNYGVGYLGGGSIRGAVVGDLMIQDQVDTNKDATETTSSDDSASSCDSFSDDWT